MKLFGTRRLFPRKPAAFWWDPNDDGLCVWSAYQPKGVANFAASLVDLTGNGNNAGDPGGASTPPWDAVNGWKFDGLADYLTTTFLPQNDQTQTMIIQFTNASLAQTTYLAGSRATVASVDRFYLTNSFPTLGNSVLYGNGGLTQTLPSMTAGNLCVAGNQGYRNGAVDGGAIGAYGIAPMFVVYIGQLNLGGIPSIGKAYYCQAFALYDCTLTAPQVAAVAAAMTAL